MEGRVKGMIREVYKKEYSFFGWAGESIHSVGRFFYRKCDKEGYLIFEKEGKMYYEDFQANLRTMKDYHKSMEGVKA